MNIWDSVQRGLEKASQEAARIAKGQRLRTVLDGMAHQLDTQQRVVIAKAMDLYIAGKMPPGDLFVACQELQHLHQHYQQAQNELNQIQSQASAGTPSSSDTPGQQRPSPNIAGSQQMPFMPVGSKPISSSYTPQTPNYHQFDSDVPPLMPPPPPGVDASGGQGAQASDTLGLVAPPPLVERNHCPTCHAALVPGNAFCHNCGTPVVFAADAQQQTVRGGADTQEDGTPIVGNAFTPVREKEPPEIVDEY
jgi:hypothetical protein